ncbi:MAG: N-acetylglucosamine-6-phosphate deacetylase [Tabrizicola sp.]|nr:N-acetylglucosamine-6-phosphate deacetylase [Tabrizicola sp.]
MRQALVPERIFDGDSIHDGAALVLDGDRIEALLPLTELPSDLPRQRLSGLLGPGFVDLQVNGGGGRMVDGSTDLAFLRDLCALHRKLGTAGILPTLITDTAEATAAVIAAGIAAAQAQVPGFLGLHLEGPHLDPRRKGAHDPALIRPMTAVDTALLCDAARALPALMVTVAPESVSPEQIATLTAAGAVVSLGHSDCSHDTALAARKAGARCATHLFNAMSQIGNREPGLAGAILTSDLGAGIIADGIHVHPATLRLTLAAKAEGLFLVTDCMAFAGSDATELRLNGRQVLRRDGRLTLADGTLAGADLTMPHAIEVLITQANCRPERALAMATSVPADVIGAARFGRLRPGTAADLVLLAGDWSLAAVLSAGAMASA